MTAFIIQYIFVFSTITYGQNSFDLSNKVFGQNQRDIIHGQTCQSKEVKVKYSDGLEIFNVCENNPEITFKEQKRYYWYTKFSKIKSTKGGSGGLLLHGNYKLYGENGNLLKEQNYALGLEHGGGKIWDSVGSIIQITKHNSGEYLYWKFKDEDDYWIEHIGPLFQKGWTKRVYTKYGRLLEDRKMSDNAKTQVEIYYENGELKEEYFIFGMSDGANTGKYISYYNNGKVKVQGQFYEGDYTNSDIKDGIWIWYSENGTLETEEQYRVELEVWPDDELKLVGGYLYDSNSQLWFKTGKWVWYTEEGKFLRKKEY